MNTSVFPYLLHLADNALIMGQRNSEWTGHGPVLEQDIAITNIALDYLGQARNLYQHAADIYNQFPEASRKEADRWIPRLWKSYDRPLEEDDLAFLRDEHQFLNAMITELPKGDWAHSILRQFFFSAFQFYQYTALQNSSDAQLAAIAEKSIKEAAYHLRWSAEWVIRLGDGTAESNHRINEALTAIWPYTGELFATEAFDKEMAAAGVGIDPAGLKQDWQSRISAVLDEAGLELPGQIWMHSGGKKGRHTEHLGYLLAEMQYLQRAYPNSTW
ncbi:MAG TPA: 1,2-phenylacetyl-CoA epoxidase subunit PaaC [Flavisolibacter sp.]|nr:1,2-phenylacetyl-CoA epoxidase subunit PaaC [Flavisolibacter sp.]